MTFQCHSGDYAPRLFWRCVYRHALPMALICHWIDPDFFKEDYEFIKEIAPVSDPEVFRVELNRFHGRNMRDKSWLRRTFLIRISGRRLMKLRRRIYGC